MTPEVRFKLLNTVQTIYLKISIYSYAFTFALQHTTRRLECYDIFMNWLFCTVPTCKRPIRYTLTSIILLKY